VRARQVLPTKPTAAKSTAKAMAQRPRTAPQQEVHSPFGAAMPASPRPKPTAVSSIQLGNGAVGKVMPCTSVIETAKEAERRSEVRTSSSPGMISPQATSPKATSPKATSPRVSSPDGRTVASVKEKQLADLRAQVMRCGFPVKGLATPSVSTTATPRCSSQREETAGSPSQAMALEEELAWAVEQMEMHRRQIEAHQRQLSILERRHAELVTALREPGRGAGVGKLFSREDSLTGPSGSGLSGLSGLSFSEVASTTSSKSLGFANAMAAAEARLGGHADGRDAQRCPRDRIVETLDGLENTRSLHPSAVVFKKQMSSKLLGESAGCVDEATLVSELLKDLHEARPMRRSFVPCESKDTNRGQPYMFGSLEVRLCPEGSRLLVRVANRLMEVNDFLAKAEAIEAKRPWRWNPIAEENEAIAGTPRSDASISRLDLEEPASKEPKRAWKHFFKAHWP